MGVGSDPLGVFDSDHFACSSGIPEASAREDDVTLDDRNNKTNAQKIFAAIFRATE